MDEYKGPSSLLAFVRSSQETGDQRIKVGTEGPILWADGKFLEELQNGCGGWDLGDHEIPAPEGDLCGLLMFEGWLETTPGDDSDVNWEGWWRQLTMWELAQLRHGQPPHGKHTPGEREEVSRG